MSLRVRSLLSVAVLLIALIPGQAASAAVEAYRVGVGIADVTGQAAEVGMLGYADPGQTTQGLASRQWARAFVVADATGNRVAFVSAEVDFVPQPVTLAVLGRLRDRFGTAYTEQNVVLAATHTHSGPGGFTEDTLYNLTTWGFERKTFDALVAGIERAVAAADADLAPGTVKIAEGRLAGANVQRSLAAFQRDPAAERALFPDAVDQRMTVLRFEQGGRPVGLLDFFATHGTSMRPDNRLINADNKGYASHLVEKRFGADWQHRGTFVAGFAQTSAGDMSPNLRGGGAQGPTDDQNENVRIIGGLQADRALELFDSATEVLSGPIQVRSRYVDFSSLDVAGRYTPDGQPHRTCPGALGQNFTAGAEDGPGPAIVKEGELTPNPLLVVAGGVLNPTPQGVRACQAPKTVFLGSGSQNPPWTTQVMPVQVLRIGRLALATAPGEFTIVSGERVRAAVQAELGGLTTHFVLAGYANAYAGYVATPEEYDAQHYEGAATHFGRYTQPAYTQELAALAAALRGGRPAAASARPRELPQTRVSFRPGIVLDAPPLGRKFGDVTVPPAARYAPGQVVDTTFVSAHPGNDLHAEGTFVEIQRRSGDGWTTVAGDADWQTEFRWTRGFGAESTARITWTVPPGTPAGSYRVVHHGDARSLFGTVTPFTGATAPFTVS